MAKRERKIHVRLPEELHKQLRVKCAYEDTTIQEYVEKVIRESVGNYKVRAGDEVEDESKEMS